MWRPSHASPTSRCEVHREQCAVEVPDVKLTVNDAFNKVVRWGCRQHETLPSSSLHSMTVLEHCHIKSKNGMSWCGDP
jgi:hypothetical protein